MRISKRIKWIDITLFLLLILTVSIIVLSFVKKPLETAEIKNFESCVLAGNPVMGSYPRQCRDEKTGNIFVEEIKDKFYCVSEDRNAEACIQVYQPVCGYDNNGNQIKSYSNSCFACINEDVKYYTFGEC